ncbi:MAG: energy transducer TonB [Oligoflexales bacterium]|nr:energy transducer TonB [Oligoflexales bacterium]
MQKGLDLDLKDDKRQKITIKMLPKNKKAAPPKEPDIRNQIVEAPLEKTLPPKESAFLGQEDHSTKDQTKVIPKPAPKAADAGQAGTVQKPLETPFSQSPVPKEMAQKSQEKSERIEQKLSPSKDTNEVKPINPRVSITADKGIEIDNPIKKNERNNYEKMLSKSYDQMNNEVVAGYQDYIDEDIKIGDRIDINTTEFRYMGYFTGMRKSIELVWNYPIEAVQRGLQGKVGLEFIIRQDGTATKIRVVKSSGYKVLDKAIVEAIELASPFSPLPSGFGKEQLVVMGNFHYQLSAYSH